MTTHPAARAWRCSADSRLVRSKTRVPGWRAPPSGTSSGCSSSCSPAVVTCATRSGREAARVGYVLAACVVADQGRGGGPRPGGHPDPRPRERAERREGDRPRRGAAADDQDPRRDIGSHQPGGRRRPGVRVGVVAGHFAAGPDQRVHHPGRGRAGGQPVTPLRGVALVRADDQGQVPVRDGQQGVQVGMGGAAADADPRGLAGGIQQRITDRALGQRARRGHVQALRPAGRSEHLVGGEPAG